MAEHISDGEETCLGCGVNVYDAMIYGPEKCPGPRSAEPITCTTETKENETA